MTKIYINTVTKEWTANEEKKKNGVMKESVWFGATNTS